MHALTRFGLDRSRFTILLMVAVVLQGALLYTTFPAREDPAITIRTAVATARFAGMAPERIEQLVAVPMERKIREIPEIDEIKTIVQAGSTTINATIHDSVDDLDPVFAEFRSKMDDVVAELPSGTQGPFVNTNFGDVAIASIAMTAEGFSYREMFDTADDLRAAIYKIDGIAKVDILGMQAERIWLEVDTSRLGTIGLQLQQLVSDLQSQNVVAPAGSLNADGINVELEVSGDFGSVRDIEALLTEVPGTGSFVRLSDIVTVRRGYVEPKTKPVYFNGQPALILSVGMQDGVDIARLGQELTATVSRFEQRLPIGYVLDYATYQPEKVRIAISGAIGNVLQTVAVVLVVVLVFLGIRSGLVTSLIVPFSMMFALIGMSLLAIDLEQVSIAAIIISLGLLVDNGVVIVEDIGGRIAQGTAPRDAALAAGRQFGTPLLVSSLTTIFAFLPLLLLEGSSGEYAFSLGAVVALTLIGSWITALYFLPALSAWMLASKGAKENRPTESDGRILDIYEMIVSAAMKQAPLVVGGAYGLVALALFVFTGLPAQMFPLSDRNQYLIYMDLPRGSHVEQTEAAALRLANWLADPAANADVANHAVYIGDGGPRFYLALNPMDADPASAFFVVNTVDFQSTLAAMERARAFAREQLPQARFKFKRLAMGGSESGIVEMKLGGPDGNRLLALARQVEARLRLAPGIAQNENDWGNKALRVVVDINQDQAKRLGLTTDSVSAVLEALLDGTTISSYREGDTSVSITVRAQAADRATIEDFVNIVVGGGPDGLIGLDQIASFEPKADFTTIRRLDQVRTITVSGKSDVLTAGELLQFVQPTLDGLELGPDHELEIGGETADSAETYSKLGSSFIVALIAMFGAILFQFNSVRRTVLTFMTIPLILIGVPFGLLLSGLPVSFFGVLGLISLAGIIINNAIVLIDQIDIERRTLPIDRAIVAASRKRFRPILLTSATTVLGLMPLFVSGGALWEPLAIVMMAGLAVASVLSLIFVPSAYRLLLGAGPG